MSGTVSIRCEMYCNEPIGPDGDPGGDCWKACCSSCREKLKFVCGVVMPAIRRQGYYSPPGASVDEEFTDMTRQVGVRAAAAELLAAVLGEDAADALGWGPLPGGAS